MSQYGEHERGYSHGYGPGSPGLGRSDELPGESAAYDDQPLGRNDEAQTLYDAKRSGGSGSKYPMMDEKRASGHPYMSRERMGGERQGAHDSRGIVDYFYKKPDPTYMGPYEEYEPQISRTKVLMVSAAVAAVAFNGYSRYKRKKQLQQQQQQQQLAMGMGMAPRRGDYHTDYRHTDYRHHRHSSAPGYHRSYTKL
ncbi:hypothetical protein H4R18_000183 [Coemansia javaensis]|uniref:Uncharacterized protein n=1 Tax=Coemansia javaensis TaxID=2761396 RepID=A0A9W8LN68_9FUNG|nr:hypothetical protein H4R18_000183 [Coemansia javaensis]